MVELICQLGGLDGYVESESFTKSIDIKAIYGDNSKLKETGWTPKYKFSESLDSVWNEALRDGGLGRK